MRSHRGPARPGTVALLLALAAALATVVGAQATDADGGDGAPHVPSLPDRILVIALVGTAVPAIVLVGLRR